MMRKLVLAVLSLSLLFQGVVHADESAYAKTLAYATKMSMNNFALWNKERVGLRYTTYEWTWNDRGLNYEDFKKLYGMFESISASKQALEKRCNTLVPTGKDFKFYWPKSWSQSKREAFQKKHGLTHYQILNAWINGRSKHLNAMADPTYSDRYFNVTGPVENAYQHYKSVHDELEKKRGWNPFPSEEEKRAFNAMNTLKKFRDVILTELGLYMGDDPELKQGPSIQEMSKKLDGWCQGSYPNRVALKPGSTDELNAEVLDPKDRSSVDAE